MAVTKLGNSKSAANSLNYVERKAELKYGLNCNVEMAKEQFMATRKLWGKNDGVQVHTVIQSFKPREVTPEQANAVGVELAYEIAGQHGFEVGIYTHTDQEHLHNHIVINSVNFETGKKYHSSKETLKAIRLANDEICKAHGLSIANKSPAKIRYTQAEQAVLTKGGDSWKDEIREAINLEASKASSYNEFKINLQGNYGIAINDSRKHIVFTHPDNGKKTRGHKLGEDYTKEGIVDVIKKQLDEKSRNGKSRSGECGEHGRHDQYREVDGAGREAKSGLSNIITQSSVSGNGSRAAAISETVNRVGREIYDLTASGNRDLEAGKRRVERENIERARAEREAQELAAKLESKTQPDLQRDLKQPKNRGLSL
jgi:hypothetical protein